MNFMKKCYNYNLNRLIALTSAATVGFSSVIPGVVFPVLYSAKKEPRMTLNEIFIAMASYQSGAILNIFPFYFLDDLLGEVKIAKIAILFAVAGWLIISFVQSIIGICIVMFLFGSWSTVFFLTIGPYLGVFSREGSRGRTFCLIAVFHNCGGFFTALLSMFMSFSTVAKVNNILTLAQGLLQIWLDDTIRATCKPIPHQPALSSVSLASLGRKASLAPEASRRSIAIDAIDSIRKSIVPTLFDSRKSIIDEIVPKSRPTRGAHGDLPTDFCALFKDSQRRYLLLYGIVLTVFQVVSPNFLILVCPVLIIPEDSPFTSKMKSPVAYFLLLSISVNCFAYLLIDKIGRRNLLLTSLGGSCVTLALLAISNVVDNVNLQLIIEKYYIQQILLSLETFFLAFGLQYIPYLIQCEIFDKMIKRKAFSVIAFVNVFLAACNQGLIAMCVIYNIRFVVFLVYIAIHGLGVFIFYSMYDTNRKTLEEISDHLFEVGFNASFETKASIISHADLPREKTLSLHTESRIIKEDELPQSDGRTLLFKARQSVFGLDKSAGQSEKISSIKTPGDEVSAQPQIASSSQKTQPIPSSNVKTTIGKPQSTHTSQDKKDSQSKGILKAGTPTIQIKETSYISIESVEKPTKQKKSPGVERNVFMDSFRYKPRPTNQSEREQRERHS